MKLKHPELYKKASDFYGYGTNLYKIVEIRGNVVRLAGVQTEVSLAQLKPVAIDGVEDRWIYYDPVIAASIVFPGDEIPAHRTDYSISASRLSRDTMKMARSYITSRRLKQMPH